MKPLVHGVNSAKKFGGKPEDYQEIHDFFDMSKAAHPDVRHRALLHNSMGCYIAEKAFGTYIVNSDGNKVSVRDIAEQHILEDMGFIPTVSDYLNHLPMLDWLGGRKRKLARTIDLVVSPLDESPEGALKPSACTEEVMAD